jgi:hypothetical protein
MATELRAGAGGGGAAPAPSPRSLPFISLSPLALPLTVS